MNGAFETQAEPARPLLSGLAQLILNWGTDLEIRGDKTQVPIAQLAIKTDDPATTTPVDELKFGDGSKPNKRYKLELKSADLAESCSDATILMGTIKTILKSGQTPTLPGEDYNPVQHNLTFNPATAGCSVKVNNKENFVVSNLSNTDLKNRNSVSPDTAVLYGGLGGAELIELSGARKEVPIEPVGVIVLAIDGLRQDVLYPPQVASGATVTASYADPHGCGENQSCYIEPTELKGLCDVVGGKYDDGFLGFFSSCDPVGWDSKHIKLPGVTAIFPSITVASWASVFTGKLPKETGILGNEFFARDLLNKNVTWNPDRANENAHVPDRYDNPAGMITFSSGAFKGYDAFGFIPKFIKDFLIPYQLNWKETVVAANTPQNDDNVLTYTTVYEQIQQEIPAVGSYFASRDGNATVVANNHYARGASHWLTWDASFRWGESAIMDDVGWDKFEDYLGDGIIAGKYDKYTDDGLKRNSVPFSAVTTWYLPGLDHEAHGKGMGAYQGYFKKITDDYVYKLVKRLKKLHEFDNKIFIVVADHGMTSMPEDLTYPAKEKILGSIDVMVSMPAEMECKLKLDFSEPSSSDEPNQIIDAYNRKEAERNNNNLHIWELGTLFTNFAPTAAEIKLLAPAELNNTGVNITQNSDQANVITALNGPMAHIYVKGVSWQSDPDQTRLGVVIDTLIRVLSMGGNASDKVKKEFSRLYASIDKILVRRTLNGPYEVVTSVGEDDSGNVTINTDSLEALNNSAYIKAGIRVTGMNHKERSGDIVLMMKDTTSGNAIDRYTTGVACKSWHGSLNPSDSYVPFIVAYPGGNKFELDPILNTVCPSNNCDGNWKLSDMVKEIIKNQYSGQ